jgi:hypothetical protein
MKKKMIMAAGLFSGKREVPYAFSSAAPAFTVIVIMNEAHSFRFYASEVVS